jgi:hypothetical protein
MSKTNGVILREDFKQAVKIFSNAFNPVNLAPGEPNPKYDKDFDVVTAFKITESELRLEQPLVTNSATYYFPVLNNINNQGSPYNTEIRLNMQDSFVITRVGIYVAFPSSATDTTFKLFGYFNPFIFGANYAAMEAFYNGAMQININNTNYLQQWGLQRHRKVNQTQQTAALASGFPEDQQDGCDDTIYPMQPFIFFTGSSNLKLYINLPAAITSIASAPTSRIVIRLEGLLAQNSTVVN